MLHEKKGKESWRIDSRIPQNILVFRKTISPFFQMGQLVIVSCRLQIVYALAAIRARYVPAGNVSEAG